MGLRAGDSIMAIDAREQASLLRVLPTSVTRTLPHSDLLLAILLAVLVLLCVILRRARQLDLPHIPGPWHHALPVLGNVLPCLRPDFHRVLLDWADQYGGIYRVKFLWRDALVVTQPEALAVIMGRGEGSMGKASQIYAPINEMCNPHGCPNLLTAAADPAWRAVRKAVAVSFSAQNTRAKLPLVVERCDLLCHRLEALGAGAVVDVDQAALRVTLDVIGLSAFGHDYGAVALDQPPPGHLLRVLPRCFTEVMMRIANPARQLAPSLFRNGPKGVAAFDAFQLEMRLLLKKVLARGRPAPSDTDIGAQLWRAMQEGRALGIDEDRVLSEIGILFVEGFETTGHTTSWTLFNIATTPGVQEQCVEELRSLGLLATPQAPTPRPPSLEDLKRLPYLTACLKEAMRMYPVVSIMGRVAEVPTRVGPYTVPAGVYVATPLFAIHNTRHNWEAPLEYRPERWQGVGVEAYVADTRLGSASKGITFMPFSEGPRNCVGQSLAKMEVMVLLVSLVGRFHIELAPEMGGREGVRSRESTHLTLQTKGTHGIRCRLYHRSLFAHPAYGAEE